MNEIELHEMMAKWLPASWKYTAGELTLIRQRAGYADPEAFDRKMAQVFESRETTGKMAVSSILHALHEASAGSQQSGYSGCASDEQFSAAMRCCEVQAQGTAKARADALMGYLDACRAKGWAMNETTRARYEAEIQRLIAKADAEEIAKRAVLSQAERMAGATA